MNNKKYDEISLQYGMILQYGEDRYVVEKYRLSDTNANDYKVHLRCLDLDQTTNHAGSWDSEYLKQRIYSGHFKIIDDGMGKEELKQLLKENLDIDVEAYYDPDKTTLIRVTIKFDNEIICKDKVRINT